MMGSLLCSVGWSGSNLVVPQIISWLNSIPWMDCVDFPFLSEGDYFWLLLCWVFRNNAVGNVDVEIYLCVCFSCLMGMETGKLTLEEKRKHALCIQTGRQLCTRNSNSKGTEAGRVTGAALRYNQKWQDWDLNWAFWS